MDGLISDVASTALKSLGSLALQEAAAAWHFKSDLDDLTETIRIIRDVLVAREGHHHHHGLLESVIDRLKDAVHEADDLIDEFTTLAERKKLMLTGSGRFTKEFRVFFSRENQVGTAFKISREIKRIRNTLNKIVGDRDQFASMLPSDEPSSVVRGRETCSFIPADDVIGRDDDKQKILDVLLGQEHHDDPRSRMVVLSIFGIGGLGKTTIAQLVFNDKDVNDRFELKSWVCVGDFIGDEFDLKLIIRKIIMSATHGSCSDDLGLEQLHSKLRETMGGKKYFLVLDDLWEEDPNKLLRLRDLLAVGEKESKVLVTTRSMDTAGRIGTIPPMKLQFLSNDASWKLFEKMTGLEQHKDQRLVQIGKEIVKKCANLPLAIKVIGSLLQGKDETEWRRFKDHDLAKIDAASGIMPLLKLSYYRLRPQLKQCFTYCSLFPKDYVMYKIEVYYQWIAQGFITSSSHPNESLEDVAEQCFTELLHRCFFQDIRRDRWGEIYTFKMHDLIHDLAKEAAGKEILIADDSGDQNNLARGVRHLSFRNCSSMQNLPSLLEGGNHLRTFLGPSLRKSEISDLINSFQCIKVLDLRGLGIKQLPESIGKLIHLRYIDLCANHFEVLPKSITGLHNLETLNLFSCKKLKELPRDLSKLVNLQNLDVRSCSKLACMPSGMGCLTRLQRLPTFIVGEGKSASTDHVYPHCCNSKPQIINASGLNDLVFLKNLRGSLEIEISRKGISDGMSIRTKEARCLLNKSNLTGLSITLNMTESADAGQDEELLECLEPHSHLKSFCLSGHYGGEKFPSWMSTNNLGFALPNLVEIRLENCSRCLNLPILSRLPSLKTAVLRDLPRLEYIESQSNYKASASKSVAFFPSLQDLDLLDLPNVRGWGTPTVCGTDQHVAHPSLPLFFPRLTRLTIRNCPNMTSMPLCPHLEKLELINFNNNLHIIMAKEEYSILPASLGPSSTSISSSSSAPNSCLSTHLLKSIEIDSIGYLNHLPKQCLQSLTELYVRGCKDGALSWSFLQHLTELVRLVIRDCPTLDFSGAHEEEADQMAWKSLERLRSLEFSYLPNLTILPKGVECLTHLQELCFEGCDNLVELPGWISQLSSLETLSIHNCEGLKSVPDGVRGLTSLRVIYLGGCGEDLVERCRKLTGEDWDKSQHVPKIVVFTKDLVRLP